jgi:pyruvate dehydrogenase E1 component alpha subunit
MITKEDLINFEKKVVQEYKKGETYGPVHLSGGNEDELICIFKNIKKDDWVFSTYRSHYHALLKSNNKKWLMNEIIKKANSSHINSKKYKIFTSAIVGGSISIALGVALGIKLKGRKEKVWCFVGDGASEMGQYWEALKYANNFDLPITFIIENNKIMCNSPTKEVWGRQTFVKNKKQIVYNYKRIYPHFGIGEWITFKHKRMKTQGDYSAYKTK